MQTEEQMKELKAQLAKITEALNTSYPDEKFPELSLGKEPKVEEVVLKPLPQCPKVEMIKPTAKEHPKHSPVVPTLAKVYDEFLTDTNEYRKWLLRSTMLESLVVTQPHVDLLRALITCVQELKFIDKEYPSKEDSIDDITLFSE